MTRHATHPKAVEGISAAPNYPPLEAGNRPPVRVDGNARQEPNRQTHGPLPSQIWKKYTGIYERYRRTVLDLGKRGYFHHGTNGFSIVFPLDELEAQTLLKDLPGMGDYYDLGNDICDALEERPDRKANLQIVAAYLSGFTQTKATDLNFVDSVILEIDTKCGDLKIGPNILAPALRELRNTSKFLPTIPEILEAIDKMNRMFKRGEQLSYDVGTAVQNARLVLRKTASENEAKREIGYDDIPF